MRASSRFYELCVTQKVYCRLRTTLYVHTVLSNLCILRNASCRQYKNSIYLYYSLTALLRAVAALNFGVLEAAI
jgi:hypothetical protein